jgi:Ankyrin repeat
LIAFEGSSDEKAIGAINKRANVNAQDEKDEYGKTPRMTAAAFNPHTEVITTLLKAGADIEAQGRPA